MNLKSFLKPTKEKGIILGVILLAHPFLLIYSTLLYHILYRFFGVAVVSTSLIEFQTSVMGLQFLVLFYYPIIPLSDALTSLLSSNNLTFLTLLVFSYWWLITCLSSAALKRLGFRKFSVMIMIIFIALSLYQADYIRSTYGLERDRGCFYEKCDYVARGFSNIKFGDCGGLEHIRESCVSICGAVETPIKNTLNHSITLGSIEAIDEYGNSCSRIFNEKIEPGGSTDIVVREGCPYFEGNLTLKVTYKQRIDDKEVQVTETGTLEPTGECKIA